MGELTRQSQQAYQYPPRQQIRLFHASGQFHRTETRKVSSDLSGSANAPLAVWLGRAGPPHLVQKSGVAHLRRDRWQRTFFNRRFGAADEHLNRPAPPLQSAADATLVHRRLPAQIDADHRVGRRQVQPHAAGIVP